MPSFAESFLSSKTAKDEGATQEAPSFAVSFLTKRNAANNQEPISQQDMVMSKYNSELGQSYLTPAPMTGTESAARRIYQGSRIFGSGLANIASGLSQVEPNSQIVSGVLKLMGEPTPAEILDKTSEKWTAEADKADLKEPVPASVYYGDLAVKIAAKFTPDLIGMMMVGGALPRAVKTSAEMTRFIQALNVSKNLAIGVGEVAGGTALAAPAGERLKTAEEIAPFGAVGGIAGDIAGPVVRRLFSSIFNGGVDYAIHRDPVSAGINAGLGIFQGAHNRVDYIPPVKGGSLFGDIGAMVPDEPKLDVSAAEPTAEPITQSPAPASSNLGHSEQDIEQMLSAAPFAPTHFLLDKAKKDLYNGTANLLRATDPEIDRRIAGAVEENMPDRRSGLDVDLSALRAAKDQATVNHLATLEENIAAAETLGIDHPLAQKARADLGKFKSDMSNVNSLIRARQNGIGRTVDPSVSSHDPVIEDRIVQDVDTETPGEAFQGMVASGEDAPIVHAGFVKKQAPIDSPEVMAATRRAAAEEVPEPLRATSIKQAQQDIEAVQQGFPPRNAVNHKTLGQSHSEAKLRLEADSSASDRLLAEITDNSRALDDVEISLLQIHKAELSNKLISARQHAQAAEAAGDEAGILWWGSQVEKQWDQSLAFREAIAPSITKTSRGLGSIRQMIDPESLNLVDMILVRQSKRGEILPLAEKLRIADVFDRFSKKDAEVTKLSAQHEKLQEAAQTKELEGKFQDWMRHQEISLGPNYLISEAQKEAARQALKKDVKGKDAGTIRSMFDNFFKMFDNAPVVEAGFGKPLGGPVIEVGLHHYEKGIVDFKKWSKKMVDEFGKWVRPFLPQSYKLTQLEYARIAKPTYIEKMKEAFDKGDFEDFGKIAQKLAMDHIAQGTKDLPEILDKVHQDLVQIDPEITTRETLDAITGYGKFRPKTEDEVKQVLKELQAQGKKIATIDDIVSGNELPKKQPILQSLENKELAKTVRQLKEAYGHNHETKFEAKAAQLEKKIEQTFEEIKAREGGTFKEKGKLVDKPDPKRIAALKDVLSSLNQDLTIIKKKIFDSDAALIKRSLDRTQKQIEKYEARIRNKDFSPLKKPLRELAPSAELQKAKLEKFKIINEYNEMLFNDQKLHWTTAQKVGNAFRQVLYSEKAIITSLDLSGLLHQGGILAIANPTEGAKAARKMIDAAFSEQAAFNSIERIKNHPLYPVLKSLGLQITETGGSLIHQEEAFMSSWARKYVPFVAASERAYVTVLNELRFNVAIKMIDGLAQDAHGNFSRKAAKEIVSYINAATGRLNMGTKAQQISVGLNSVLFAPQLAMSRFKYLSGKPLWGGTMESRKIIAQQYAKFFGGVGVMLALGKLAGGSIDTDQYSSDFMKLRFGNTRIDPWGGLQQAAVFSARLAGRKTTNKFGETKKNKPWDVITFYGRTKLAPVPGALISLRQGTTPVGEKATPGLIAWNTLAPLNVQDVWQAMVNDGIPAATAALLLGTFGMTVSSYSTQKTGQDVLSPAQKKQYEEMLQRALR